MSAVKKAKASELTWADIVRQPTGMALCDSGGTSGRHWQRPLPADGIKLESYSSEKYKEILAYIPLHSFLLEHFEIDQKLTRWLRRECDKQSRYGYSEYAEMLATKLDLEVLTSNYTYNWENDLSQDFQFSVVGPAGADWVHSNECYLVIESHNGADARGGFSDPIVAKPSDPASWLDVVCGVEFHNGTDANGATMERDALQALDERLQVGYTSCPASAFNKEIGEIHSVDEKGNKFDVTLKSGERVQGSYYYRNSNGGYNY